MKKLFFICCLILSSCSFFNKKTVEIKVDSSPQGAEIFINNQNFGETPAVINIPAKDGIIILDDFLWFYYKDIKNNPIGAIIECYDQFKNNLKLIFVNHQIIFKKLI